jgi:acyl dehydratase
MAHAEASQAGMTLPVLDKPRLTSTHIVRWLAAQQNWDRIHFDQIFCEDVAKLQSPVINGALKQHMVAQFLVQALPGCWPWRMDYKFIGPDYVGDKLRVQGCISGRQTHDGREFVSVEVEIVNTGRNEVTTRGTAVVLLDPEGPQVLNALALDAPAEMALPEQVLAPDASVPADINARLGSILADRASHYAIDLSRLRLFADAVMDLPACHYDTTAGTASPWGAVVAPPLFPLHALEALPGTLPLSEQADAQGREGVNEVGRDLAPLFGLSPSGGMNAGNRVQVHSLARAGEFVHARSRLVGVRQRRAKSGGEMIFFESLNHYTEAGGRPLLTERQSVVLRLPG